MSYLTSFAKFLETEVGRKLADPEFADRLTRSGVKVETIDGLLKFAKTRWPEEFPADHRGDTGTPHGRGAMRRIWSAYLAWKVGAAERKAPPKAVAG